MILSCDPPRHAFLIHFGKREQPRSLQTASCSLDGALMQIALNPSTDPPALVAIHFVRHGFRLPFVQRDGFSVSGFHLSSGRHGHRHYFHFSYVPEDYQEWESYPGLTVLVSEPPRFCSDFERGADAQKRPVLHGFLVDTELLTVDIDMAEFVVTFGADNLKDVPVDLFVRYGDVDTSRT